MLLSPQPHFRLSVSDTRPAVSPEDLALQLRERRRQVENAEESLAILQQVIHESEERFNALYMNLPVAYDSLDAEGRIVRINQAWLDMLGYEREEVIGRWLGDFYTPFYREDFRQNWPLVMASGTVNSVSVELVRKDGSIVEVLLQGRVAFDADGQCLRTHCLTQDVTARKKADEALRRSEREKALILDIMSDWVVYHDTGMEVLWANKDEVLPYADRPERIVGKCCHRELFNRETPCEACPIARVLETGQPETGEILHDGRYFVLRGFPVRDAAGTLVGVVQVTMDITEHKQLEREILDISALERARVGRDLHDGLGQMLTGLSFMASALRDRLAETGQPEAAEAAQLADIATTALQQTRLMAKGLVSTQTEGKDLLEVLMDLAVSMESLFKVRVRVECAPDIRENRPGIFNHLHNLIQEAVCNAVKHGKACHIHLSARLTRGRMFLSIQNDGLPLEPGFRQTKGLGLKIMDYRASALGGTFAIYNLEEGGVLTSCSLPWTP
ncbi:MAG: sensor signal transduction histidine kinase [Holophagaceae bacterium]|nr:sensor signal transduction histidine kinase [Holophagaceae bacterium]